jgi:hypothetical protein
MDTAGARALAQRLAEGKDPDEITLDERLAAEARSAKSSSADPPLDPPLDPRTPAPAEDGVIYIRPGRRSSAQEVWVYVRASDGRLRRTR